MTCNVFLDMEGLMTNYGLTGTNLTRHILSFLDFDSMVAARMVSKTWYHFIENEPELWIKHLKKCCEGLDKKRFFNSSTHEIVNLGKN